MAKILNRKYISEGLERLAKRMEKLPEVRKAFGSRIEDFEIIIKKAAEELRPSGTYECFHCGERAVIWGGDHTFEDYGAEGEGIVQNLHCSNCGADILYYVPIEGEDNGNN